MKTLEFTEAELLIAYDKYVEDWPKYGDGPYIYEAWKEDYLSKRTYSD